MGLVTQRCRSRPPQRAHARAEQQCGAEDLPHMIRGTPSAAHPQPTRPAGQQSRGRITTHVTLFLEQRRRSTGRRCRTSTIKARGGSVRGRGTGRGQEEHPRVRERPPILGLGEKLADGTQGMIVTPQASGGCRREDTRGVSGPRERRSRERSGGGDRLDGHLSSMGHRQSKLGHKGEQIHHDLQAGPYPARRSVGSVRPGSVSVLPGDHQRCPPFTR